MFQKSRLEYIFGKDFTLAITMRIKRAIEQRADRRQNSQRLLIITNSTIVRYTENPAPHKLTTGRKKPNQYLF
jgi:hypothetical protein